MIPDSVDSPETPDSPNDAKYENLRPDIQKLNEALHLQLNEKEIAKRFLPSILGLTVFNGNHLQFGSSFDLLALVLLIFRATLSRRRMQIWAKSPAKWWLASLVSAE